MVKAKGSKLPTAEQLENDTTDISTPPKSPEANGVAEKPKPFPVKYPKVVFKQYCEGELGPLREEQAKELLGWKEVDGGTDYDLIDKIGKKVRMMNNRNNRDIRVGDATGVAQEVLNKRWRYNLETMIISKTGNTTSCQHRLVGLIFANQLYRANPVKWIHHWPESPTMETVIAFGGSDDPEVIRTIDNVRTRSYVDVLTTDPTMFGSVKGAARAKMCRMLDYAVRLLWSRTGLKDDAYAPKRTHSEGLEFISRHPRIKDAVKHIAEEDANGNISKYVSAGTAAGLLYLMGTGDSNYDDWNLAESRSEEQLKFDLWDKACTFWVLINSLSAGGGKQELEALRRARREGVYAIDDKFNGLIFSRAADSGSSDERIVHIIKAWQAYVKGGTITDSDLKVKYVFKDEAYRLAEDPTCDGIDLGGRFQDKDKSDDDNEDEEPTEEEKSKVEEEKARVAEQANKKKLDDANKEKIKAANERIRAKKAAAKK